MTAFAEAEPRTLIDELLAEQQALTAVERFARKHERNALPAQSRYYRELIPLAKPQPGEQYAFGVDLDACTGCKACVSACHSLNGLDDDEIWRNIGLIHGGTSDAPYQQTVTTACHHCVEPACLEGCPVRAYEKDAVTGIVRHLDDQCIGCQYCVLKCPYDVPKYSTKRGIVRKCDMCHSRLAANEAPACVQACPSGAITIRVVSKSEVTKSTKSGAQLLPGAFDSHYTKPTTSYTTRKSMPANARPGDATTLRLEHPHWPLIGMLVLTQIAAGLFGTASLTTSERGALNVAGLIILHLGLGVSVLHLGRPLGAWRAFLGLRTSWMSREIFAFSAFAGIAVASTLSSLWPWFASYVLALQAVTAIVYPARFATPLAHATTALGLFSVFCSAMIYVDTRRVFWNHQLVFTKFFGTSFLLGAAGAAALLAWSGSELARTFAFAATIIRTALFGWEFQTFRTAWRDENDPTHRSALIMWTLLRPLLVSRVALFFVSTAFGLLAISLTGWFAAFCATLSFGFTALSQLIERYLFFTAVVAPRMPGPVAPSHS
jgi:Fe-S-cluster-containing dehydrogenase component/DMSO reductase anchor subunit